MRAVPRPRDTQGAIIYVSSEHSEEDAKHATHPSIAGLWILEIKIPEVVHCISTTNICECRLKASTSTYSSQSAVQAEASSHTVQFTNRLLSLTSSIQSILLPMVLPFKYP